MNELWELTINTPDGEIYNLNPNGAIMRGGEEETVEIAYKEFGKYIARNSPQGEVCDTAEAAKNNNERVQSLCKTCLNIAKCEDEFSYKTRIVIDCSGYNDERSGTKNVS